ncbi:hypothetical protein GY45DRAFT_1335367 [Cubamyces sp. BRFM 1775]|nr:hypothetical protein GY45DRAFT_1335367 [Cubamyces sp. BRFM 1775]
MARHYYGVKFWSRPSRTVNRGAIESDSERGLSEESDSDSDTGEWNSRRTGVEEATFDAEPYGTENLGGPPMGAGEDATEEGDTEAEGGNIPAEEGDVGEGGGVAGVTANWPLEVTEAAKAAYTDMLEEQGIPLTESGPEPSAEAAR